MSSQAPMSSAPRISQSLAPVSSASSLSSSKYPEIASSASRSSSSKYLEPERSTTYRTSASRTGTLPPPMASQVKTSQQSQAPHQSQATRGSLYPTIRGNEELSFAGVENQQGILMRTDSGDATHLRRDTTIVPAGTNLRRDNTSIAAQNMLRRDDRDDDDAPPRVSIFTTKFDIEMAIRHSRYRSLPPELQKENDDWIIAYIEKHGPCPDKYNWQKHNGGYMCSGGGHGMTHEMIGEQMGAICAMPKGRNFMWTEKEGPYYQSNTGGYEFHEDVFFPGVRKPAKYTSLYSSKTGGSRQY